MIDDPLRQLENRALDHSLESLESDIWSGLALRVRHRTMARRRVYFQGAVMALSLIVSIAIGSHATRLAKASRGHALFALGLELAPSSLLLGNSQ